MFCDVMIFSELGGAQRCFSMVTVFLSLVRHTLTTPLICRLVLGEACKVTARHGPHVHGNSRILVIISLCRGSAALTGRTCFSCHRCILGRRGSLTAVTAPSGPVRTVGCRRDGDELRTSARESLCTCVSCWSSDRDVCA